MRSSRAAAAFSPLKVVAVAGLMLSVGCAAAGAEFEESTARFQATYVWQRHSSFPAAYSGPNSLSADKEKSYTFSATAYLGLRPWSGAELYFDPEAVQGVPLSHVQGLGGLTNGEIQKTSGPQLKLYRARAFLRQTWGFGGGSETVEPGANQLAGSVDRRRLVVTAGNLAVIDIFDRNEYAGDPRTQFLNWSFLTHGAYDYAADARGYSWGLAAEWYDDGWALRAGRFIQPREPNQLPLEYRLTRHYGDQIEVEHAHTLAGRPGKLRLLVFRNRARMARYGDALDFAAASGGVPDINLVRNGDQSKRGVGLSLEQSLGDGAGLFARLARADGRTETYAFTEVDASASLGLLLKGDAWGRGEDGVGVALARNTLSAAHRDYLAAGGLGFFLGDGRLDYRPETILEAFYNLNLTKGSWLALDWQRIGNPAYNADRGPLSVFALRFHAEF